MAAFDPHLELSRHRTIVEEGAERVKRAEGIPGTTNRVLDAATVIPPK